MNGEPLPAVHGGPVRLVVPGWAGNNWTKWVRRIVVARDESPGFFMQTGYRMSTTRRTRDRLAIRQTPARHLDEREIAHHLAAGRSGDARRAVEVRGIAWTGRGHVSKVEVSLDRGGRWVEATLRG